MISTQAIGGGRIPVSERRRCKKTSSWLQRSRSWPRKRRYACTTGTGLGALPGQRRCAQPWDQASSLFGGEHECTPGKPERERPGKYCGAPRADSSRRGRLRTRHDVFGATGLRTSCARLLFLVVDLREASMQLSNPFKTLLSALVALAAMGIGGSLVPAQNESNPAAEAKSQACPNDDSGLKLPAGCCVTVFADDMGHDRHMVVAPSGVLYVNTWSGKYYGNDTPHAGGFLVALQDKSGTGKAGGIERFGETVQSGGAGGTGIGMYKGSIYAEINDRIVRYSLPAGSIVPSGSAETIVSGLPLGGDHPMHPFIINAAGLMYVDVASATNSCQLKNRTLKSPGADPCTELETRAGILRYDANKTNQTFSTADRFATGV